MLFPNQLYEAAALLGVGLGGLAGAYSLAVSWGAFTSVSGLLFGASGIIIGAGIGVIGGVIAPIIALGIIDAVLTTVITLSAFLLTGLVLGVGLGLGLGLSLIPR